jgi:hypothetical protein
LFIWLSAECHFFDEENCGPPSDRICLDVLARGALFATARMAIHAADGLLSTRQECVGRYTGSQACLLDARRPIDQQCTAETMPE